MSTTIHGWRPADVLPEVDDEGESNFVLVLAAGFVAPIVAFYLDGKHGQAGERWSGAVIGSPQRLDVRWWKPLDPIPASLFPPSTAKWALLSGMAFDDTRGE